jgi:LysM repeat protein
LAKKYKCSAKELAALNGMKPSQPLKAGQVFKIPGTKSSTVIATNQVKANKGTAPGVGRKKPPTSANKKRT